MKNNKEISQISLPEWQRRQCWDEEVRMQSSFYEDEHDARVAWYGYDDGGNRAVKLSGECVALTQNGNTVTVAALADPVVYPSPLVTLSKRGYTNVAEVESRGSLLAMPRQGNVYGVNVAEVESRGSLLAMPRQGNVYGVKHYFEGERRICSAIGGCAVKPCLITAVFESAERSSTTAGTARVPFSAPDGRYRKHPQDAFFTHVAWDSIDASQDKAVKEICDELSPLLDDGVEEAMHCVELNDIHLSGRLIYRMLWLEATKPHDDPEPVYYYHNDHCRSREQSRACTGYAETRQCRRSQRLGGTAKCFVYNVSQAKTLPESGYFLRFGSEVHWTSSSYGEDWVDVTTFMYDTSQIGFYQFNGKEKDPETDYLYYGARYHWPDAWNGWLSPDPLMDEYPNISPYAYCNWNPVNLVDPDGMECGDYYSTNGKYLGWDGKFDNKVYIIKDEEPATDKYGLINASKVSTQLITSYETLGATLGVYNRTKRNRGYLEESTAMVADYSPLIGNQGYYGSDGLPHCVFPDIQQYQKDIGITSIHSHPFMPINGGYSTSDPSSDDISLFEDCKMNIIVGYLNVPESSRHSFPNTSKNIGASFFSSEGKKIAQMSIRAIEKIVDYRNKAFKKHWKTIIRR